MIVFLFGSLLILVLTVFLFIRCSPQFGAKLNDKSKEHYEASMNFNNGIFTNKNNLKVSPEITFSGFIAGFSQLFSKNPDARASLPQGPIAVEHPTKQDLKKVKDSTRLIWFGHSTFLLQTENKNILIDPMFGQVASPISWIGTKRFSTELPIEIQDLPEIDAVILSHDHYDHLDYGSILAIKDKVRIFYTPLGVGMHLEKWGVSPDKIIELDWWESSSLEGLNFVCTPAQHASGRSPLAMSNTLWSSWVIQSENTNIFFSGDGGYGSHFKSIGQHYGPFDFALLECGQYNEQWPLLHMFPEQTAQAAMDLNAAQIMPIHWGAFRLSDHGWHESIDRLLEASKQPVIIPKIGEPILIEEQIKYSNQSWWENY